MDNYVWMTTEIIMRGVLFMIQLTMVVKVFQTVALHQRRLHMATFRYQAQGPDPTQVPVVAVQRLSDTSVSSRAVRATQRIRVVL
jgi:hypothetical protein